MSDEFSNKICLVWQSQRDPYNCALCATPTNFNSLFCWGCQITHPEIAGLKATKTEFLNQFGQMDSWSHSNFISEQVRKELRSVSLLRIISKLKQYAKVNLYIWSNNMLFKLNCGNFNLSNFFGYWSKYMPIIFKYSQFRLSNFFGYCGKHTPNIDGLYISFAIHPTPVSKSFKYSK